MLGVSPVHERHCYDAGVQLYAQLVPEALGAGSRRSWIAPLGFRWHEGGHDAGVVFSTRDGLQEAAFALQSFGAMARRAHCLTSAKRVVVTRTVPTRSPWVCRGRRRQSGGNAVREAHIPAQQHHPETATRLPEPRPYAQRPECAKAAKVQEAPGADSMTRTKT